MTDGGKITRSIQTLTFKLGGLYSFRYIFCSGLHDAKILMPRLAAPRIPPPRPPRCRSMSHLHPLPLPNCCVRLKGIWNNIQTSRTTSRYVERLKRKRIPRSSITKVCCTHRRYEQIVYDIIPNEKGSFQAVKLQSTWPTSKSHIVEPY